MLPFLLCSLAYVFEIKIKITDGKETVKQNTKFNMGSFKQRFYKANYDTHTSIHLAHSL